jgi:hypothetical protein
VARIGEATLGAARRRKTRRGVLLGRPLGDRAPSRRHFGFIERDNLSGEFAELKWLVKTDLDDPVIRADKESYDLLPALAASIQRLAHGQARGLHRDHRQAYVITTTTAWTRPPGRPCSSGPATGRLFSRASPGD